MKIRKKIHEKLDAYLEKLNVATKELETEQEILEDLVTPQSIKEKERNLKLLLEITSKFQTLHENTETIRENNLTIAKIPEILYPETPGQNKIKSLNRDNWTLIKDVIAINDSILESFKIILEKMKV